MVASWPRISRNVITIDEDACTGCGDCIPNCPEGALQIVDGKARLVSESLCDGLGACAGRCPTGAMKVEEQVAEEYSEEDAMQNIVEKGHEAICSHLKHLRDHGKDELLKQAVDYLKKNNILVAVNEQHLETEPKTPCGGSCPGSAVVDMRQKDGLRRNHPVEETGDSNPALSRLSNWPVQIDLVPSGVPFLGDANILLAADCAPFAYPGFHEKLLKDKVLLVGCPKLDNAGSYIDKLATIFRDNNIRSVTCVRMEVPCCSGLTSIAKSAMSQSGKNAPFGEVVIGVDGSQKNGL